MTHSLMLAVVVKCLAAAVFVAPVPTTVAPGFQTEKEAGLLFVHGQGDDSAVGSRAAPLRTISAALARARSQGQTPRVRISVGLYDAASGESFPLDLSGGAQLFGLGSDISVIDAGAAAVALELGPETHARAVLSGLSLRGENVGMALGAALPGEHLDNVNEQPAQDRSKGGGAAPLERRVALRDVLLEGFQVGLALDLGSRAAPLPIDLLADGLRIRRTEFGLRVLGEGHLTMTLVDCDLEGGQVGLVLESDPTENVDEPRRRTEEGVAQVYHDLTLRRTRIARMSHSGLLRVGRDGRNRGGAYVFEDCTFSNNEVGVEFRRPTLDSEVRFSGTSFLANRSFGLRLTGDLGPQEDAVAVNLIEDCLFRWNGVGAHITSSQIPLVIRRTRFLDNQGNGLFVANFLTDPTEVLLESSLFAHNGSHGVYSLADSRLQSLTILNCTVVGNDTGGIRDHRRHSGTSRFRMEASIVVGNGAREDLIDVDPSLVAWSLVGGFKGLAEEETPAAFGAAGNLLGLDPHFIDPAAGRWDLESDSPCRIPPGAQASSALRDAWPNLDLLGRPFHREGAVETDGSRPMGCLR